METMSCCMVPMLGKARTLSPFSVLVEREGILEEFVDIVAG